MVAHARLRFKGTGEKRKIEPAHELLEITELELPQSRASCTICLQWASISHKGLATLNRPVAHPYFLHFCL